MLQNTLREVQHLRTFGSLLITDNSTRVFGHCPVPQADCTLLNLKRKITLSLTLSWMWIPLTFTTGKRSIFHSFTGMASPHVYPAPFYTKGVSFPKTVTGSNRDLLDSDLKTGMLNGCSISSPKTWTGWKRTLRILSQLRTICSKASPLLHIKKNTK